MDKLLKAIYFASVKHVNQKRRDGKTPYISHPLGVALILTKITNDENIIISGILHDIVEDTSTSIKEIEEKFGKNVAKIVFECTEQVLDNDWIDRKKAVLAKIPKMSKNAGLVKSADVLHNSFEIVERVKENGLSYLKNFHADPLVKLEYEFNRLNALKKHHPNQLLKDIEKNIKVLEKLIKQ